MTRYESHGHGAAPGGNWSTGPTSVAVVPCASEETRLLLPGKTQPTRFQDGRKPTPYDLLGLLVFLFLFLFVIATLCIHFINCPLYPSTMNTIRQQWGEEEAQHNLLREEWRLMKLEHDAVEEMWKVETEWHDKDVARRIREEGDRQERARHEWELETEQHDKDVARRMREEGERQERVRQEYEEMERRENQRRENQRDKWRREVENHDRIEEERRKREEEERQKLNLFWSGIQAHTCTTYATREYTAQLMNLPTTWEHRVEACKVTPLEVHGISYFPKSCEDRGHGTVIGRWEINQHEPDCAPFWLWYKDKGCTSPGSGKRRIEHYLEALPEGGNWREFCATTPAHFHGLEFSGAQECFQIDLGTYGHWEIDDADCQ
ncbi:hypothetical protein HD554DRAFT_2194559 [Boletus coccyginus]|nr:hypothetical protein HD554DRAFT_2194559 [Boletus coccyginus]